MEAIFIALVGVKITKIRSFRNSDTYLPVKTNA